MPEVEPQFNQVVWLLFGKVRHTTIGGWAVCGANPGESGAVLEWDNDHGGKLGAAKHSKTCEDCRYWVVCYWCGKCST